MKHIINKIFNIENQGVKELNIPIMRPINAKTMSLKANKKSPVSVDLDFNNLKVYLNQPVDSSVKWVSFDFFKVITSITLAI